jgi:hypothetical protein
MKRSLTLFTLSLGAFLFLFLTLSSTKVPLNDCGITVTKSYNQQVLGKNIGFFVIFKNNTTRSLDAIEYKVIYKNGFDEVKGTRSFTWQSGNFFGPKLPGESLKDGSTTWVDDANKIEVVIMRVHFTDGYSCK